MSPSHLPFVSRPVKSDFDQESIRSGLASFPPGLADLCDLEPLQIAVVAVGVVPKIGSHPNSHRTDCEFHEAGRVRRRKLLPALPLPARKLDSVESQRLLLSASNENR